MARSAHLPPNDGSPAVPTLTHVVTVAVAVAPPAVVVAVVVVSSVVPSVSTVMARVVVAPAFVVPSPVPTAVTATVVRAVVVRPTPRVHYPNSHPDINPVSEQAKYQQVDAGLQSCSSSSSNARAASSCE